MIRNRSNAEHYIWGGDCDGWRLLDRPDLGVNEERIPPGRGEVRHFHRQARQLFFVISGQLGIEAGGVRHTLGPGDSLEIPPGEPHVAFNASREDVSFVLVSAPSTRGDRVNVDEAGRPVA